MATNTPKLNLVKPEMSDYADIRVLNGNMDILDKEVGGLDFVKDVTKSDEGLTFTKKDDSKIQVPLNYMPTTGGNFTGDITIQDNAVDYVIERIEQGRSYYEKYNSGKLVQVIYKQIGSEFYGSGSTSLTFLTPFSNTDYLAWLSYEVNATDRSGVQNTNLNPTSGGAGSNNTTVDGWGGRSTTNLTVVVDYKTDVFVLCVGRWK